MPTVAGKASVGWKCPVIIDNMMNLELMFEATKLSGDSTFYNIAVSHANTTMKNHFREDNSCFHVVDYDPRDRCRAQPPDGSGLRRLLGLGTRTSMGTLWLHHVLSLHQGPQLS